ncbi:FKBP-type peptidyl-prolyl cis-trans isomerase N-terminal domain-containing protein, partial [Streptococcus pyogenes]
MGVKEINIEDFSQAISDVIEGNKTKISHAEARDIVNAFFQEIAQKANADNIQQGKVFLEENKKRAN